jgi:hypothetical protein
MQDSMMMAEVGDMLKVRGSRIATPLAPPLLQTGTLAERAAAASTFSNPAVMSCTSLSFGAAPKNSLSNGTRGIATTKSASFKAASKSGVICAATWRVQPSGSIPRKMSTIFFGNGGVRRTRVSTLLPGPLDEFPQLLDRRTHVEVDGFVPGKRGPGVGENNTMAKLTADKVAEVKRLLREGMMGKDVARICGISKQAVSQIKTGRIWSHVK